jgi:YfiR/HmsC-like
MRLLLTVVAAIWSVRGAPAEIGLDYQVKAMFLYNFAKFVEWPAEKLPAGKPIVIAVYGQDPFGGTLEQTLQGKTANGSALVMRRLTELTELKDCHILFISSSEKKRLGQILQKVGDGSVLTIADVKGFAEQGGMVNLTTRGDTVGLEVNASAVERAHIKISYKLLRLAKMVQDQSPSGKN